MSGVTGWRMTALGAVLVLAACRSGESGDASASPGVQERVVNVEVLELTAERYAEFVNVTGMAEARRDVTVSSEESGVVRRLFVERGAQVRAGQPLVQLDDAVLRAQHEQARAQAALAADLYERQRRLWEDERIGSELAFVRARSEAEAAAAHARAVAARLARTTIRAPIDGVLDDRYVEVGALLAPGTPVARIVDAGAIKVVGGVPERHAAHIQAGGDAVITFDHLIGEEFRGTTRFVGTALNEQNRTFPVEIAVPNRGGVIKPGMVAKIAVRRGTVEQAMLVPREAVLRSEAGYIVYVVVAEGTVQVAQARAVTLGGGSVGRVVVETGLLPGDLVVVVGHQQLAGGDIVRVVTTRRPAEP